MYLKNKIVICSALRAYQAFADFLWECKIKPLK